MSKSDRQLVGAARWPDDAPGLNISNKSHTEENKRYSESMWKASRSAASSIASGRISSFDNLWSTATDWRLSRIPRNDSHRPDFSSTRVPGTSFVTSLRMPYQSVLNRVLEHPDARSETYDGEYLRGIDTKVYRQHGMLSGMEIPMSVISGSTDAQSVSRQTWDSAGRYGSSQVQASMNSSHPDMIKHTDAEYLPIIKRHLESLYSRAKNPALSASEVLDLVSRVHWWAASAAPDKRGSAAKAEFAARSIASAHGIELPPFRHGAVPDIEAMLSSEEEFASRYAELFERRPL